MISRRSQCGRRGRRGDAGLRMSAAYLAILAVLLSGFGARDHVKIAGLSLRQGQRPAVFVTGALVCIATAAFAGWAAAYIAPVMAPEARLFLSAIALGLAGAESLIFAPRDKPGEPTHSLGALAIVLLSHQLTDAARFLIFGIAVAANAPLAAGLGGALGGIVLIGWSWAFPQHVIAGRTRTVRRSIGVFLLCLGVYVGLTAIGKL